MDMTRVGAPNPMLLAIARGAKPSQPRRITWFMLGSLVGGLVVWCATSNVRADVYGARVWTADVLRSLRGAPSPPTEDLTPSHVDAPLAPLAPPEPPTPPSSVAAPVAAPTASPPASPGGAKDVAKDVPTVDVAALPRTPPPDVPAAAEPVAPEAPQPTAAPALPNAPGPR